MPAFLFALTVLAILFAICPEMMYHSSLPSSRTRYARFTFLFWFALGWILCCLAITLAMGGEEIARIVETTGSDIRIFWIPLCIRIHSTTTEATG